MKQTISMIFISGMLFILVAIGYFLGYNTHSAMNEFNEKRITKLEKYKTSTEPIISGLNDEILELRDITDEFRAQIKGLQKEVFVGVQEEGL